jgi:hypothetical protein
LQATKGIIKSFLSEFSHRYYFNPSRILRPWFHFAVVEWRKFSFVAMQLQPEVYLIRANAEPVAI